MGAEFSAVSDCTEPNAVGAGIRLQGVSMKLRISCPSHPMPPVRPALCSSSRSAGGCDVRDCRKRVMFDIGVCEAKQIVLIRFTGELTESDFAGLDRMAADARGNAEFDCIFDFTAVERIDVATEFVAKRGDLPQAFKDRERIYVVPQDDLKLLTRLYAAYQTAKGWRSPVIVATLDEALDRLGVVQSDFHPMPIDMPIE
jgi:hypothetical protein